MFDALFANLGTVSKAIVCLQHIESLLVNVLVGLEGEAKNAAISAIVQVLETHKNQSVAHAPVENQPQG